MSQEKKTQPEETNPSVEDVPTEGSTEEGKETTQEQQVSPEDLAKQIIEKATGREFSSLEEAEKTMSSTYSENSRLAQEAGKKAQEVEKKEQEQKPGAPVSEGLNEVKSQLAELKFKQVYPEAGEYLDKVKVISASTGGDYVKAFEESGLLEVFKSKQATKVQEEEARKEIPEGSQKIAASPDVRKNAEEAYQKGDVNPYLAILAEKLFSEKEGN